MKRIRTTDNEEVIIVDYDKEKDTLFLATNKGGVQVVLEFSNISLNKILDTFTYLTDKMLKKVPPKKEFDLVRISHGNGTTIIGTEQIRFTIASNKDGNQIVLDFTFKELFNILLEFNRYSPEILEELDTLGRLKFGVK